MTRHGTTRRDLRRRAPHPGASLRAAVAGLAVALLVAPPALAGPKGGKVASGRVKIKQHGHKTRIKASDGAAIDWDSFDIGAGEKVRFVQPDRKARVLNRVDDSAPTRIDGRLRANGQVYIVNSAGVYFGGEAVVDVGRLVAAGGVMRLDDFRDGVDRFRRLSGAVENQGRIDARAIALVGRTVRNNGRLTAHDGEVAMLAGDAVWLGDPESDVRIKVGELSDLEEAGAAAPAVENTGTVDARHGRARLAAGDGLSLALREASRVRARKIHVEADDVEVAGRLDARDTRKGRKGGQILVLGDTIRALGADIDASGDAGGGQVRIGGGFQGGEGLRAAHVTGLDDETAVRADALRKGDGGAVVVWSDGYSFVGAETSAKGGARGGDGGLVETSSKRTLQVLRAADVSAAEGKAGTWLLDPSNVRIVADGETDTGPGEENLDDSPGARRPLLALFQSDGPPATVSAGTIEDALEVGTSVVVTTDTFNAVGDDVGNITLEQGAPIRVDTDLADGGVLMLLAANDIEIKDDIEVVDGSNYRLSLFLVANDNELGTVSLTANDLRRSFAEAAGRRFEAPAVQPEKGQTQPVTEGGLDGNPQAELGNLIIDPGVSIDTGGGQIQGQGRNIRFKEDGSVPAGTIETDGGSVLLIAENPVAYRDRVTSGGAGKLQINKDLFTDGGGAGMRALGNLQIDDGVQLDFTDADGDGSFVQMDGRKIEVDGDIRTGRGGLDLGRSGIPGIKDTQSMVIGGVSDDVTIASKGEIRLIGGDQNLDVAINNCPNGDCSQRTSADEVDILLSGQSLQVDEGSTLDIGASDQVEIDMQEDVVVDGTLTVDGGSRSRILAGLAINNSNNPNDLAALEGLVNIVIDDNSDDPDAPSSIAGEEVALRTGDGRNGKRDEIAAANPDDPRLTATILIPDGFVDAGTSDFKLIQDASLVDAPGQQPVPALDPGAQITLESADGSLTLQDPATPGRLVDQDVTLRAGSGDPPIVIDPALTLSPASLALRVDNDLTVDQSLAAQLRPDESLELWAGYSGNGDLVLDGTDAVNTTEIVADEITLRAGDGSSSLSGDDPQKIDSTVRFDGSNVEFSLADPAGGEPLSLTWRQDSTIGTSTITPEGSSFSSTLDPLGDGSGDPDGDVQLAFRSDDGAIQIASVAPEVSGENRQLMLTARTGVETDPTNPFRVRQADVGGVDDFTVTQEVVDGFAFEDPGAGWDQSAQSSLTLRGAYGRGGELRFDESQAQGVTVSAQEIQLAATADEDGNGGGRVVVHTNNASLQPRFTGPGGPDTNPNVFAMHQADDIDDALVPEAGFFGAGRYPMTVALRSDLVPAQDSALESIEITDLSILPQDEDRLLILSGPEVSIAAITPESSDGTAPPPEDLDFAGLTGDVLVEGNLVLLTAVRQNARDGGDAPSIDASDHLYLTGFVSDNDFPGSQVDPVSGERELTLADAFPQSEDGTATSPIDVVMEQEGQWSLASLPTLDKWGSGDLGDNGQTTGFADEALAVKLELISTRAGIDVSDGALVDRINGANLRLDVKANGPGVGTAIDPDTGEKYPRTIFWGPNAYDFEALNAIAQQAMEIDGTAGLISIDVLEQLRLKAGGNGKAGQDLELVGNVDLSGETIRLLAGNGNSAANVGESEDPAEVGPKVIFDSSAGSAFDLSFTGEGNVSTDDTTLLALRQDASLRDADLPDPDQIVVDDGTLDELDVSADEGSIELTQTDRLEAQTVTLTAGQVGLASNSRISIAADGLSFRPVDPDDPDAPATILQAETVALERTDPGQLVLGGTELQLNGRSGPGSRPGRIDIIQQSRIFRGDTMVEPSQLGAALPGAKVKLVSRGDDVFIGNDLADRLLFTNLRLEAADSVEIDVDPGLRDHSLDLASLKATADIDEDDNGRILLATEQVDGVDPSQSNRSSIRTVGLQQYLSPTAIAANVRLKGDRVAFRDRVEAAGGGLDSGLVVKVNTVARFGDDVGRIAPLDRLEVILGKPPGNELTEAGFADRSDLGDTRLVLRRTDDGDPTRPEPQRLTIRTRGDLKLRRKEDDVPRTAIVEARGDDVVDEFVLESLRGDVRFGSQMRMAVDGSLLVRSLDPGDPAAGDGPGIVKVADLAVAGRLSLVAPEVFIRRRDGGRMVQASGAEVRDSGTQIVSNELRIDTNNLVLAGDGRDPLFGLPYPLDAPDVLRGADGTLRFPVAAIKKNFEPIDGRDVRLAPGSDEGIFGTFTIIKPEGPTAADLAQDLPIVPPGTPQPMPVIFAALDRKALDTIGIDLRPVTPAELATRREGAAVYDDVRPVTVPVDVVSPRLLADRTEEAARSYRRLFGERGENAPKIRQVLQEALDDYRRETRARRIVGFEFRRYVKNRPSGQFAAHQALLELDNLFHNHRNTGLSRAEYRRIQATWLRQIKPEGITVDELSEAIHPSRYVRGSDILDIFGD